MGLRQVTIAQLVKTESDQETAKNAVAEFMRASGRKEMYTFCKKVQHRVMAHLKKQLTQMDYKSFEVEKVQLLRSVDIVRSLPPESAVIELDMRCASFSVLKVFAGVDPDVTWESFLRQVIPDDTRSETGLTVDIPDVLYRSKFLRIVALSDIPPCWDVVTLRLAEHLVNHLGPLTMTVQGDAVTVATDASGLVVDALESFDHAHLFKTREFATQATKGGSTHVHWPSHANLARLFLQENEEHPFLASRTLIATEKLDGSNLGFYVKNNELVALFGRNAVVWDRDLCKHPFHSQKYAGVSLKTLEDVEDSVLRLAAGRTLVVYGEMMRAPTVRWICFGTALLSEMGPEFYTSDPEQMSEMVACGLNVPRVLTPEPMPLLDLLTHIHEDMLSAPRGFEGVVISDATGGPANLKYKTRFYEEQGHFWPDDETCASEHTEALALVREVFSTKRKPLSLDKSVSLAYTSAHSKETFGPEDTERLKNIMHEDIMVQYGIKAPNAAKLKRLIEEFIACGQRKQI